MSIAKTLLYDKVISVYFTVDAVPPVVVYPKITAVDKLTYGAASTSLDFLKFQMGLFNNPKVQPIVCYDKGIKPDISIYGTFLPGNNTQMFTIKIVNLYTDIDISHYRYIHVVAGYRSGSTITISGEVMNCYIEKPSPQGVTVFQCVTSKTEQYSRRFFVDFTGDIFVPLHEFIEKILKESGMAYDISIGAELKKYLVPTNRKVYYFNNIDDALNTIKEVAVRLEQFTPYTKVFDLVPGIRLSNNKVTVDLLTSDGKDMQKRKDGLILVNNISSAYFDSAAVTINAPWMPELLPESPFAISLKYFRGRMGTQPITSYLKEKIGVFKVTTLELAFGTNNGDNNMKVIATPLEGV